MLAFAVFAVAFVAALIIAIVYLYPVSKKPTNIPGLDPKTKEDGNLGDIKRAGSLHEFLLDLHKLFGPIASFWLGPTFTVSIASADLFKEHIHLFDRPPNGAEGKARRHFYDKVLTHDACKKYFSQFQEIADDLATKWQQLNDSTQHIPVCQYTMSFALKAVLLALFGNFMKDDKEVLEFERHYAQVWTEMELRLTETPTEDRENTFQENKKALVGVIKRIVKHRKTQPPEHGEELLLDLVLDYSDDEELHYSDSIGYAIGGFHSTGNTLAWCMYFIATHQEVDKKIYAEIQSVLGEETVDHTNMAKLVYLHQVINETLRCAVVTPWAARFQDTDSELGGYVIPAKTPVIHALGVTAQNETVWPQPDKFDPDRFSKEASLHRSHFWFSMFGIAGKRVCPGQKFAYAEAIVCLVTLLRKFKFHMVEGQVVKPTYGLVTHPEEEIWVTLSKRGEN